MINWGHFIGNPDRKEVASMWSASLGFVPTQGCTSWLLWYLRFILLKRVNRREWSGWKCLYKRAERQKNKRPDSTPMIGPILSTMGLCKVVWEGKQGEWEGAVFRVSIPVFPRLHFHPSHGTTLVTPLFLCPLLSVLSDSELEAVLSFLSSWRVTSVHLWDEKMTISLPVFHLTRFFLFFFSGERLEGGRKLLHAGWKGAWRRSPARFVGGGRGSGCETGWGRNPRSLEMAGNDPRKTSAILVSSCPVGKCFP